MTDPLRLLPEKAEDLLLKDAFEGITLPPAELVPKWPHEFKFGGPGQSLTFVFKDKVHWTQFINSPALDTLQALKLTLDELGPGEHVAEAGEA